MPRRNLGSIAWSRAEHACPTKAWGVVFGLAILAGVDPIRQFVLFGSQSREVPLCGVVERRFTPVTRDNFMNRRSCRDITLQSSVPRHAHMGKPTLKQNKR